MKRLFSVLFVFLAHHLHAQPTYQWAKAPTNLAGLGGFESADCIGTDAAGNIYLAGRFAKRADLDPSLATFDLVTTSLQGGFIAKYSATGGLLWAQQLTGTEFYNSRDMAVDAAGNLYLTGNFSGTMDFDPGAGTASSTSSASDAFIAVYNTAGVYQWHTVIGGSGADEAYSISVDGTGAILLAGYFNGAADLDPGAGTAPVSSSNMFDSDAFLAKYTSTGAFIWGFGLGAASTDEAMGVATDGSNNVYVLGRFAQTIDFDPSAATANRSASGTNAFLAKYTAAGVFSYAKVIGSGGQVYPSDLAVTAAGEAIIGGYTANNADFDPDAGTVIINPASGFDAFIARYNTTGGYVFAKQLVGSANQDEITGVALDGAGNICVVGHFYNTVDFDPGAGTANLTSNGGMDAFVAKYTGAGAYLWANKIGGSNFDQGFGIAVNPSNDVLPAGYFDTYADFDPNPATQAGLVAGGGDGYFARYTSAGAYAFAGNIGRYGDAFTTGSTAVRHLARDAAGNLYVLGTLDGRSDLDASASVADFSSFGGTDVFLTKYSAAGAFIWARQFGGADYEQPVGLAVWGPDRVYVGVRYNSTADADPGAGTVPYTATTSATFLTALDAAGSYQWSINLPGTNTPQSNCVAADATGNVFIANVYTGTGDFDPSASTANLTAIGSSDAYVAKYSPTGAYLWAKSIGGAGTYADAAAVTTSSTGGVFVAGSFGGTVDFDPGAGVASRTATAFGDGYFAALDGSGAYLWAGSVASSYTSRTQCLATDGLGNLLVGGYHSGTSDFDPLAATASIVATTPTGFAEPFIAKYNGSTGAYIFAKAFGGTSAGPVYAITTDAANSILVTGSFGGTRDFDPDGGVANLSSPSSDNIFLAKYTDAGAYVYAYPLGSASATDQGRALITDGAGTIYLGGDFGATMDMDFTATVANLSNTTNTTQGFWARYNESTPLSLNGLDFTAAKTGERRVQTTWKATTRENAVAYEVERSSDGKRFETIARVAAIAGIMRYDYEDAMLVTSRNFYRLRALDAAGGVTYSVVREVVLGEAVSIRMYPVPAVDAVWIEGAETSREARLTDLQGRVLRRYSLQGGRQELSLQGLAAGTYVLTVDGAGMYRVVKK